MTKGTARWYTNVCVRYGHMVKIKFLPPTNTKGPRYKVTWPDLLHHDKTISVTWDRDYDLDEIDYWYMAVNAFCDWCNQNVFQGQHWAVHDVMAGYEDEGTYIVLVRIAPIYED